MRPSEPVDEALPNRIQYDGPRVLTSRLLDAACGSCFADNCASESDLAHAGS